jgi:hypothetical protein
MFYTDAVGARYSFSVKLWRYPGDSAWHFVSVPKAESARIKANIKVRRGWGSVRVKAKVGQTAWETSVFPDSKSGMYLLPVKSAVRRKEGIDEGDKIAITLTTL